MTTYHLKLPVFNRLQLLSKTFTVSTKKSSTKLDALKRKNHQNAAKLWYLSVLWQGAVGHEVTSKLELTPNMAHQLAPFFLFFFFFSFFFVLLSMMIHVRSGGDGRWRLPWKKVSNASVSIRNWRCNFGRSSYTRTTQGCGSFRLWKTAIPTLIQHSTWRCKT